MIGVGSPNRPNHLGRNSLTCQSSIVLRGYTRFLGGEARVSKSCNGSNVKKSAVGMMVSERY